MNQHDLLPILLRIEQARHPLVDRGTLPGLLDQIAQDMLAVPQIAGVAIQVRADLFDPPLPVTVQCGTLALEPVTYDLAWAGVALGQVRLALTAERSDPPAVLPLLLRVISESIAEVRAVELLVQQTRAQVRQDIAFDLHDAVRNTLAGILLLADAAAHEIDTNPHQARQRLCAIREAAHQSRDRVRFLIGHLRGQPVAADFQATLDALLSFFAQVDPDLTIQTRLALPGVDGDTAACLVGMLRNALTNVVEHAHASLVQVSLYQDDADVVLHVCDDGMGCDAAQALAEPGVGLDSLCAWVRQRGGQIAYATSPGNGFALEVRLPLAKTRP